MSDTAPPDPPVHVLVLDDDAALCQLVVDALSAAEMRVTPATDPKSALEALREHRFDVLLSDVKLAGDSGFDFAKEAVRHAPGLPVVMMTAFGSMDTAIRAIRSGAHDFLNKPFDLRELQLTVERAARFARLTREVERLQDMAAGAPKARGVVLVGESPPLRALVDLAERVASSDVTVLVQGESGTGKELVARLIHDRSPRRESPFVAINCGALPSELLESELFGHEKGAFTGASTARDGLFVGAGSGTLFLDEVGEMPADMQVKLLRALQEKTVRRVGSNRERSFDARIVAATNRDLAEEVRAGRFREDLFYRLEVVRIDVPPLRERGNDVLSLASHFLSRAAERTGRDVRALDRLCAAKLLEYDWPGNVRELENAMERAVALAEWSEVSVADLPMRIREHNVDALQTAGLADGALPSLQDLEEQYIERVLERCDGNKSEAARILGIDRRTLYRKLERQEEESNGDDY